MATTSTPTTKPKSNLLRKILFTVLGFVLISLLVTFLIFNYTYSEGNRAGLLIKFSQKGYVFKTYEGELNLGGVSNGPNGGLVNQIWNFSVAENAVADSLMHCEGLRVRLHYKEKVKVLFWTGETNYLVDGVEVIK